LNINLENIQLQSLKMNVREKLNIGIHDVVFVIVGAIIHDQLSIIEIFFQFIEKFPNSYFIHFGFYINQYSYESIQQDVKLLNLESRFFLFNNLSYEESLIYMSSSDVFISIHEKDNVEINSAMRMGLPIIYSQVDIYSYDGNDFLSQNHFLIFI
jgi:hypothetical protein